jgi:UDP-GlcNAc:undecaprenyl-phosphate GlcNAc-1-phosphate transferase
LFVRSENQPFSLRRNESDAAGEEKDLGNDARYSTLPAKLLGLVVPLFLVTGVFLPTSVPVDLGYAAIGLFTIVLAGFTLIPATAPVLVRLGLYVGGTFVIYLIEEPMAGGSRSLAGPSNVFFLGLTLLIMLTVRFGVKSRFQMTPLDYLMVFLACAIPLLPEMRIGDINLSVLTAKLIVMFLAFELMLHALAERLRQFGLVSLWVLFFLGLRAWW